VQAHEDGAQAHEDGVQAQGGAQAQAGVQSHEDGVQAHEDGVQTSQAGGDHGVLPPPAHRHACRLRPFHRGQHQGLQGASDLFNRRVDTAHERCLALEERIDTHERWLSADGEDHDDEEVD